MRGRWHAFTVDEYQDVNLLQQTLLDLWLGPRDDLCVVGDDYQSIYGFTGASPRWLLGVPARFPHAHVVRLERNYRSTPQVLELANRLVPKLGGSEKTLRAEGGDGPEPELRACLDQGEQAGAVVARVRELAAAGVPLDEQAVLLRTNARTTEFEEAFHEAGIAFQGASLLDRDAARRLLKALRAESASSAVAETVRAAGRSRTVSSTRRRRSSATASRRGRPTSRGSSRSRRSSTTASGRSPSSARRCTTGSARARAAASTC